jgi:hypothetical protein
MVDDEYLTIPLASKYGKHGPLSFLTLPRLRFCAIYFPNP